MGLSSQTVLPAACSFGGFEFHPERGLLLRDGTRVKLQPQPFRILAQLILRAPAIVSRDELAEAIWPDVHVDIDQSLNFCIRQIRTALDDSAAAPRFVETLPKQGYRFVAPLVPLVAPDVTRDGDHAALSPSQLPDPRQTEAPPGSRPLVLRRSHRRRHPFLAAAIAIFALAATGALLARHGHGAPNTPPAHSAVINPEAHDLYVRGRYLWFRGANEEAGQDFRRAIELDPNYALAWAGLSNYYGQGAGGTLDPRQALPKSEAAARKAVELDPASAEAHLSLGAAFYLNRWDWTAAQREIDRALELDPRFAQALHFRANILSSLDRHTEAIAAERMAAEIDPFARPWGMTSRLLLARHYQDARQSAFNYIHADPSSLHALTSLEAVDCALGMTRECIATRRRHLDLAGDHAASVRLDDTFVIRGARAVLRSDLAALKLRAPRQYVPPFDFARIYIQLGDRDSALRYLEDALEQHDPGLLLTQNFAIFDSLHEDPRYRAVIRGVGLPPAF